MSTRFIEHDGLRLTSRQWEERLGLRRKRLRILLHRGYSMDDIIAGRIRKPGQRTEEGEARKNAAVTVHGHSTGARQSSEYRAWADIKNRCTNPNVKTYRFYGARGVTVCQRWLDSFENFLADMGRKPSRKHSIDRRNNNLGYSPENCRWATREEQDNNKSDTHILEFNGLRMSVTQWAKQLGVTREMLFGRIRRGWTTEQILLGTHPSARGPRKPRRNGDAAELPQVRQAELFH